MTKDMIGYRKLVDDGLRGVVRAALSLAAADGWPGAHHAYVTFRTDSPGVRVPDAVKAQYPDELTIVLQNQFWGLEVGDEAFEVGLSFNKVRQTIRVPFMALTRYADPSVEFGLQFQAESAVDEPDGSDQEGAEVGDQVAVEITQSEDDKIGDQSKNRTVVTLDSFRKK